MERCDVAIVGAGLAGLRCAQVLSEAGLEVVVLDAAPQVGGRLASRMVDGHLLDVGFALINPAYPELEASGVLADLDLRPFARGLDLVTGDRVVTFEEPWRRPSTPFAAWRAGLVRPKDLAALATVALDVRFGSPQGRAGADRPAREALRTLGLSELALDRLVDPFLAGALLERGLGASWRYVRMVLRSFLRGRPSTTPTGVAALPAALARRAPGARWRLGEAVQAVAADRVDVSGGSLRARAVVVATDADAAARLVGTAPVRWLAQSAWWLSTPRLEGPARLRVDLDGGPVSGVLDLSGPAPERAPTGRSLLCATALGAGAPATPEVLGAVARLMGLGTGEIELIAQDQVARAVWATRAPLALATPSERDGLFVAGDHLQTPSIQGALVSGRRAAQAVLRALGR